MAATDIPQISEDPLAGALEWDWGTAYELLLSVHTIFNPKAYGVPAPWAAGVRKRLSPQGQLDLKSFFAPAFGVIAYTPLHLVLEMDRPKDVQRFLDYVEAIPGPDFSLRMHSCITSDSALASITEKALSGEQVSDAEVDEYRRIAGRLRMSPAPSIAEVRTLFAEMADPASTKRRWLATMREYHAVFFAEEEKREQPVLERMLVEAQALSRTTSVTDMIERLSNGFTISEDIDLRRLVLVPSIWTHPFVVRFDLSDQELFIAWGAHPYGYRLVPGESVPDDALLVLRALSDPTRLRLLRLVAVEPRSPQSLAHELKLSLPTVSHHMRELRAAGLIRLEVGGKGRESKYSVRWPSARLAFDQLEQFVLPGPDA